MSPSPDFFVGRLSEATQGFSALQTQPERPGELTPPGVMLNGWEMEVHDERPWPAPVSVGRGSRCSERPLRV